jgi:sec-independent protein translocase protein TatA
MGSLGAPEIILIILAILLLFGYKKLPDASRSLGRSLRIFKGEMKGMKADDDVRTKDAATATPVVRGEVAAAPTVTPAATATAAPVPQPEAARLEEEARAAEARAAELRARAEQARAEQTPTGSADGAR